MSTTKQKFLKTKDRINYLLVKYSLKTKHEKMQGSYLPEPDYQRYLDEDPNFLPFYGMA
jgi:hypothetical protein